MQKKETQSISPAEARPSDERALAYSLPLMDGERDDIMAAQRRYLEELHLPSDTSQYRFSGFEHLEQATNQAQKRFIEDDQSPIVIFTHLTPEEFQQHQDNLPGRVDYNSPLQLLILTILSLPHEVATREFDVLVRGKAQEKGVRRVLISRGSTCTDDRDRNKEADSSWSPSPRHLPPGRNTQWPSIAMEVAYSESRGKVKRDMEYWLNRSDDVRMGVTVDIKKSSGNIFITSWRRGAPVLPRTHMDPEPEQIQEIKILRGKAGQKPLVTGDNNLVVPFEDIMLRLPSIAQGEGDFIFTREELLEIAETIWEVMDTM